MNQLPGNTDTVKKIITWSSQFSENFLEVGVIFLSVNVMHASVNFHKNIPYGLGVMAHKQFTIWNLVKGR